MDDMEKIRDFDFCNLVLAAKHWYVRGENESIYDFILRLVRLEDRYLVFLGDRKGQAVKFCLMCMDELAAHFRSNGVRKWWDSYLTMESEIQKYMCLYCADGREEALILFVFNVLMQLDGSEIELPKPIYGRGYPRLYNQNGYTYKNMRRKADSIFGK